MFSLSKILIMEINITYAVSGLILLGKYAINLSIGDFFLLNWVRN